MNGKNFPPTDIEEKHGDWIYEIANAFPFRGSTYIARRWAEGKVDDPTTIALPPQTPFSFSTCLREWVENNRLSEVNVESLLKAMPEPVLLTIASLSNDENDLVLLSRLCCDFEFDSVSGLPVGLMFDRDKGGKTKARISNRALFEILANNPSLPEVYKEVMVLRPGVQGDSEIVGEWIQEESHVFEYLRRNSYIPWGHYAANMSHDAVRYRVGDLSLADMRGLRHLYYQRSYTRVADQLGITYSDGRKTIEEGDLESLRRKILHRFRSGEVSRFNRTLWGWNYGFDMSASLYRLHASHQQVHQQFSLIPSTMTGLEWETEGREMMGEDSPYSCGQLVERFTLEYQAQTERDFFDDYLLAIATNRRLDERQNDNQSLVIFETESVLLFVPKAQTSQWEIQLMTKGSVGNIMEADTKTRQAIDYAILVAMRVLEKMGAMMVTSIEYSKRFDFFDTNQRLLYAFLPKLPESPGAFSEAQLRWINGHYPEDFAAACRGKLRDALNSISQQETRRDIQ